ncbi:aspartate/glutamate racemase family protein [Larkinella terrae]|uniref:Amino acid racemase n=1 Tax=Larkinella terrae TaxID=2025311 RepID=A0A7K0ECT5_9BACT|nr:aspartate/glutamate racemase family protein [Larkinella terrae]MRS59744.1 amino acid racemase [Larkinella terrae]
MKTIGIIGGMTWESSAVYYRIINQEIGRRLGGHHSAKLVMASADFEEYTIWQKADDWASVEKAVDELAQSLVRAGADCVVIACNTQHEVAEGVIERLPIPLLHITDVTAEAIQKAGFRKVGLLGTRFTMKRPFFRGRLKNRYGIDVILPDEEEQTYVHQKIYEEFSKGIFSDSTRAQFVTIIEKLAGQGAEGVILGCTEIPLLVQAEHTTVPLFDTTTLHALAAVEFSLERSPMED